jgi:TolB-like protein
MLRTMIASLVIAAWTIPSLSAAEPSPAGLSVAVVDLVDRGPSVELAVLRIGVAEMLASDLSQYEGLHVVERVRVAQFLSEAKLQAGFTDEASTRRVGEALAADYLLTGTFQGKQQQIQIDLALTKVGESRPLATWHETTTVDALAKTEAALLPKLLAALGVKPTRKTPPPTQKGKTPLVAVMGLRNLSPSARLDPMETGFGDILQANLGTSENVRMVDRGFLYAVMREQRISLSGLADPQTMIRVGRLLGAERLIYGSFVELGPTLRIDLRLADARSAALVRAETAAGPSEQFAALLKDIALRVAADLAVSPAADTARPVQTDSPTQKLEAAIHLANARRAYYTERFREAAEHYERVLLIEPENAAATVLRVRAWTCHRDYDKAIQAAEQGLSAPSATVGSQLRKDLIGCLSGLYTATGQWQKAADLDRSLTAETPAENADALATCKQAQHLALAGRVAEGIAMMKAVVERERRNGTRESYEDALRGLMRVLAVGYRVADGSVPRYPGPSDPELRRQLSAEMRDTAQLRLELFLAKLSDCERHPGPQWDRWIIDALIGVEETYYDEAGKPQPVLNDDQRAAVYARFARVFSHNPGMVRTTMERLAEVNWKNERWRLALEGYEYLLEHPRTTPGHFQLSFTGDTYYHASYENYGRWITARLRRGQILARLERNAEAADAFQQLIADAGLHHELGEPMFKALRELGQEPRFPEGRALVRGFADFAFRAYERLLKPMGIDTHLFGLPEINAADLAPYRLVILVQPGRQPFTPAEVMALRAYVAGGGGLLVVVSPGWYAAQPGILNPLLATFGIHAGDEEIPRARNTKNAKHPITKSVKRVMAKAAVGLEAPGRSAIIRAGDRAILAALTYRRGRVVVASFGQWFTPDPSISLSRGSLPAAFRTSEIGYREFPVEIGDALHLPLLRNVLTWLAGDKVQAASTERQRMLAAQAVAWKALHRFAKVSELQTAMDRWIVEAAPGADREEALWGAAEAALRCGSPQEPREFTWPEYPPELAWRCLRRLRDEYPQSPLKPFAEWRLADCWRRRAMSTDYRPGQYLKAAAELAKVEVPEAGYPWAWNKLGLGQCYLWAADYAAAAKQFRLVADRIGPGAEKSLATLDAGLACRLAGDPATARRYYESARAMPDLHWWSTSYYESWAPLGENRTLDNGLQTNRLASNRLQRLDAKPQDP